MRFVHGSEVKSHMPRLNTISLAPDFFATPVLGQIKSTCPMLRLLSNPFSGTPFNSAFTSRNSRFALTGFAVTILHPLSKSNWPYPHHKGPTRVSPRRRRNLFTKQKFRQMNMFNAITREVESIHGKNNLPILVWH